jgi:hypothetical protein
MDLDIFDDIVSAISSVIQDASPATQKTLEQHIVDIVDLAMSRRNHEFKLGKHLCEIRMTLANEDPELAERMNVALGALSKHCYRTMRLYQRFVSFEQHLPRISEQVQRYFAEHAYLPAALQDVVAIVRDGREVTMHVLKDEVLPKYKSIPASELVEDPPEQQAITAHLAADDDRDPWDIDEEDDDDTPIMTPEPSSEDAGAADPPSGSAGGSSTTAGGAQVDRVDLDDMRTKLIRNATHELSGAIRSIDNFCGTYHVGKGRWFLRFKNGGDELLGALQDWQLTDRTLRPKR